MPYHEEIRAFSEQLLAFLPGYGLADEHQPSRVVLLAKNEYYDQQQPSWKTWIDFEAFFNYLSAHPDANDIPSKSYSVRWTKQEQHKELAANEASVDEVELERENC